MPIAPNDPRTENGNLSARSEHRPILIVVFAIAAILLAGRASAWDGCPDCGQMTARENPIQLYGQSWFVDEGGTPAAESHSSKPRYALLAAGLANFDADAEVDGWRAEVVILDDHDRPVAMPASAVFTLSKMTWSMPLEFDSRGIASVRLPAPASLNTTFPNRTTNSRYRTSDRNNSAKRSFLLDPLQLRLAIPRSGRLTVRVTVPGEGTFAADTFVGLPLFVDLNGSSLVDSWDIEL